MNIVIPMAGQGRRFVEAGFVNPKPLIPVQGVPMFLWSLAGLPLQQSSRLIFLCRGAELSNSDLESQLHGYYGRYNPVILAVDQPTQGQACTVLLAKEYINADQPLLIHNIDTWFKSDLSESLPVLHSDIEGVITVFKAEGLRWSFVKIDDAGLITEVAEKQAISHWATVGMYYFRSGAVFTDAAERMISEGLTVNGEYYVGPIYNYLIERGAKILPDFAHAVGCMGTPEDLAEFLARDLRVEDVLPR